MHVIRQSLPCFLQLQLWIPSPVRGVNRPCISAPCQQCLSWLGVSLYMFTGIYIATIGN